MTTRADQIDATSTVTVLNDSTSKTHDIFEGTEQFLLLVISRAISGMRIE